MRTKSWVVVGVASLLVAGAAVVAWRADEQHATPVAEGRSSDACSGRGDVGLIGYDLRTGAERWTNVVGTDAQNLWTPGPDGDVTSGDNDHAFVIDGSGHVRSILAATGAVDRCVDVTDLEPEKVGRPIAVDGTGAYAVEEVLHRVEVREADGQQRWQVGKRQLLGASTGGVVVWTNPQTTCCDETGEQRLAVLDPVSSKPRWTGGDPSGVLAVTADHLITMTPSADESRTSPRGEMAWRVSALDMADGTEAWHVDRTSFGFDVKADAGRIVLSWRDPDGRDRITLIDEADGRERWTATVPNPGRGGAATEAGGVIGAAIAGDVLVVAVAAVPPHRD